MSTINATNCVIKISEDNGSTFSTVGYATNIKVAVNHAIRDVTTNSSGGTASFAEGGRSFIFNGEGLITYSSESDITKPNTLYGYLNNRQLRFVEIYSTDTYDFNYVGYAYMESYEIEDDTEETQTFSFTMKMEGYAGMGYADYTASRARFNGGYGMAVACAQTKIETFMAIDL